MLSRIQQTDLSVPYLLRGYLYFTKTVEGRQYPLHYRRRLGQSDQNDSADDSTTDELLLDLNALAEGQSFLGLGAFEVSDNNRWLAYSIDTTGFRQYLLQIKDLQTLDTLPFRAEHVTSVAWASDNRTFYIATLYPSVGLSMGPRMGLTVLLSPKSIRSFMRNPTNAFVSVSNARAAALI